mmetsp:Transcript_16301/g.24664  ORF Transcript_16301/g.24664 Transcript_16301/m.24664 type:complete len:486 (+) Transcript_16301:176-1633(+)
MKILFVVLALFSLLSAVNTSICNECPPLKSVCTVHNEKVPDSWELDPADGTYFTCACAEGYSGDGWRCQPINECEEAYPCPPVGSFCVDTSPTDQDYPMYKCGCLRGYEAGETDTHGAKTCNEIKGGPREESGKEIEEESGEDIEEESGEESDEVVEESCVDTCTGNNKECVDDECVCKAGYFPTNGVASAHCEDQNECRERYPNNCHPYAKCVNTEGSYWCACTDGWKDSDSTTSSPGTKCVNINECEEEVDDCTDDEVCVDRLPPQLYECVNPTPAPTNRPTGGCRNQLKYFDDFEAYDLDYSLLTESKWWFGDNNDYDYIVDTDASSGLQSLYTSNNITEDYLFLDFNKVYRKTFDVILDMMVKVEAGRSASIRLFGGEGPPILRLEFFSVGEVGVYDYFSSFQNVSYPNGEWFNLKFRIDTRDDIWNTYVNGDLIDTFTSSSSDSEVAFMLIIPEALDVDESGIFVDDVRLQDRDYSKDCP